MPKENPCMHLNLSTQSGVSVTHERNATPSMLVREHTPSAVEHVKNLDLKSIKKGLDIFLRHSTNYQIFAGMIL